MNEYGLLLGKPLIYGMRREEMVELRDAFVMAGKRAQRAGYDALELHLGHGYLLSQFLSPRINRRRDAYGGSPENRMRFPLEVVRAVRDALPNIALLVKLNLDDGVEGGLHVEECCVIARALEAAGVNALVLSGGLVSRSSMFLLRGGRPLERMREGRTSRLDEGRALGLRALDGEGRALWSALLSRPRDARAPCREDAARVARWRPRIERCEYGHGVWL